MADIPRPPRHERLLIKVVMPKQGAERKAPHVPADMPPKDYAGKDYQLDKALDLIRTGKAVVTPRDVAAAPAQKPVSTPQ